VTGNRLAPELGSGVLPAGSEEPAGNAHDGDSANTAVRMIDIQRARLLAGAVVAVDEHGYARASVAHICVGARVSRRTFYEIFRDYEDCIVVLLETTLGRMVAQIVAARLEDLSWCERVRTTLWIVLCFLDREPTLARVVLVQSGTGGQRIRELREQTITRLAAALEEGRAVSEEDGGRSLLTAEAFVGAVLWILAGRLARHTPEPLADLHGELMAMIVLPYLGRSAAQAERSRPTPAWRFSDLAIDPPPEERRDMPAAATHRAGRGDPLGGISMRLTYRTVRVLEALAHEPGLSNRRVAEESGITDQGQVSKLLARLEGHGLLENARAPEVRGPNEWHLTSAGRHVVRQSG